jgi:DNA-binding MarR family transcriptional regulator
VVRVGDGFADEFPGGDASSTEAYATLVRTGEALMAEIDRAIRVTFGLPHAALTALAVIEGAGEPLTPSQVSERVLAPSATMTATLDLIERQGWIRRIANPADRRSVLLEVTQEGRDATDRLLPGIRTVEQSILSALDPGEREVLLGLLSRVLARAAEVAARPAEPLSGKRNRPARTGGGDRPARAG